MDYTINFREKQEEIDRMKETQRRFIGEINRTVAEEEKRRYEYWSRVMVNFCGVFYLLIVFYVCTTNAGFLWGAGGAGVIAAIASLKA